MSDIKKEVEEYEITSIESTAAFEGGKPDEVVKERVQQIVEDHPPLAPFQEIIEKGAILANDEGEVTENHIKLYPEGTVEEVEYEKKHPIRSQSRTMLLLAVAASFAAVNFGQDESAVGGAQLQYQKEFNIVDSNLQGLVNAAPYLAAGIIGAPLAAYLENFVGRRKIVFLSCIFGLAGSLWQAFTHSMGSLLAARLFLGVGMGLNSSAVPLLIAESSPARSRGVFLMLWQTFVAFGVMLGSVFNRAFVNISGSLSWRLMIGSSSVAPLITAILILFVPESPRYSIADKKPADALNTLVKLRGNDLLGARDFYVLYESLRREHEVDKLSIWQQISTLFRVRGVRFSFLISSFNMFMQQWCGVNVLVGYTATILVGAGIDSETAIAGSIGIGGGCFLATFLSSQLIDRFGRRKMLLFTFPLLGACLFWLGGALNIASNTARLGAGLTPMYLFVIFFGLGIGPVSWTYNAEVYPLSVRSFGVSLGMVINWTLDFVLSMTWPHMAETMTTSGGLYYYGAWNFYAFFFTYFFIPETMRLTLEDIQKLLAPGTLAFAKAQTKKLFRR